MATCNCMGSLCGKCRCACACTCHKDQLPLFVSEGDWLAFIKLYGYEPEESLENVLPTLPKK